MGGVLGPVALDHLVVPGVPAQRELYLDDVVAGLHEHEDSLDLLLLLVDGDASLHVVHELLLDDLAGPVEEVLDHVEELGIAGGRDVLEPLRDLVVCEVTRLHLTAAGHGYRHRRLLDQARKL